MKTCTPTPWTDEQESKWLDLPDAVANRIDAAIFDQIVNMPEFTDRINAARIVAMENRGNPPEQYRQVHDVIERSRPGFAALVGAVAEANKGLDLCRKLLSAVFRMAIPDLEGPGLDRLQRDIDRPQPLRRHTDTPVRPNGVDDPDPFETF